MEFEKIYYANGQLKQCGCTEDGKRCGLWITYHENGVKEWEWNFRDGEPIGFYQEWYDNGQLAEEGEHVNGKFKVINFWDENGIQILSNGTGKTIRKFGAWGGDVYEQYFKDYEYLGEKKIAGYTYLGFIPNNEKNNER